VEVRQNGRVSKISKREVIIKQLVKRAAEGKPREMELLLLKMALLQRDWREPRKSNIGNVEAFVRAREILRGAV
jgi:Family of unknown function (DUF5681)